jgi:hypothetical protein
MRSFKPQNDCTWRYYSRKLAFVGGALAFLLGLLLPSSSLEADNERLAGAAVSLTVR